VIVADPQDAQALALQITSTLGIRLSTPIMAHAVDFHNKRGLVAEEIRDEGADRELAAELQSSEATTAYQAPQVLLRDRRSPAHVTSPLDHGRVRRPLRMSHGGLSMHRSLAPRGERGRDRDHEPEATTAGLVGALICSDSPRRVITPIGAASPWRTLASL